ncbi:MAG: inositol monophosphatase [Pseudomonadota bacterium]
MSLDAKETDALIQAVRDTAKAEIVPRFRGLAGTDVDAKGAPDDLVTVADRASEIAITAAVAGILPSARIVGEEAVAEDISLLDGVGKPGQTVVIDPIDGTWNYANGLATYGVILSVVEDGETVFGLLYDPSGDDWIVAYRGGGAWFVRPDRDAIPLSVSRPGTDLGTSFGFVGLYLYNKPGQAKIAETLPRFRRTVSLRCSCHEYRLLAQGRSDFMLNGMLNVWDHAAGVLALEEAGGVARLLDGRPYAPAMREGLLLNAASEPLWDRLAETWAGLTQL